jgi:hypothetical protein
MRSNARMKSLLTAATLAIAFSVASPLAAQVIYVQVGPPTAIVETVPVRPAAGYVWVGGYYSWNGSRYVWVHGHWVAHAGAWCAGHWRHVEHHGWYWIPGHWC